MKLILSAYADRIFKNIIMIAKYKMAQEINSHFVFENKSWIRLIEFLIQENTIMKTRLSEVMYQIHDRESLAIAEHFQDKFIIKDDVFEHLINDLKIESRKWDLYKKNDPSVYLNELKLTHKAHKLDIERLEQALDTLKKDYNTFLATLQSSTDFLN
jgi:hypothetical protein